MSSAITKARTLFPFKSGLKNIFEDISPTTTVWPSGSQPFKTVLSDSFTPDQANTLIKNFYLTDQSPWQLTPVRAQILGGKILIRTTGALVEALIDVPVEEDTWYDIGFKLEVFSGSIGFTTFGVPTVNYHTSSTLTTSGYYVFRVKIPRGVTTTRIYFIRNGGVADVAISKPAVLKVPTGFVQASSSERNYIRNPKFKGTYTSGIANLWGLYNPNSVDSSGIVDLDSSGNQIIEKKDGATAHRIGIFTNSVLGASYNLLYVKARFKLLQKSTGAKVDIIINPVKASVGVDNYVVEVALDPYAINDYITLESFKDILQVYATDYDEINIYISIKDNNAMILMDYAFSNRGVLNYFDGSSVGCTWEGTANASISAANVNDRCQYGNLITFGSSGTVGGWFYYDVNSIKSAYNTTNFQFSETVLFASDTGRQILSLTNNAYSGVIDAKGKDDIVGYIPLANGIQGLMVTGWNHFALVWDDPKGIRQLYVNGQPATMTGNTELYFNSVVNNLHMGRSETITFSSDRRPTIFESIDRFYSPVVFTQEEIIDVMNKGSRAYVYPDTP